MTNTKRAAEPRTVNRKQEALDELEATIGEWYVGSIDQEQLAWIGSEFIRAMMLGKGKCQ